jgi:hypothetical protein
MLDHLSAAEISTLIDDLREEISEHQITIGHLESQMRSALKALNERGERAILLVAEADSPKFSVGDGVRTHNGFAGVVSGVITRRTSGPTVEIHAEAADGRLGPSLGLWYRHQLTKIEEVA